MKKIKYIIISLFLVSCSSNYILRVESPSEWYKRNKQEVENKNVVKKDDSLPNIKEKLEDIKKDIASKEELNQFKNIKPTEAYTEENNFFSNNIPITKPTETIQVIENEGDMVDNNMLPPEVQIVSPISPDITKNVEVKVETPDIKPVEVVKIVEVVKPIEVYVPTPTTPIVDVPKSNTEEVKVETPKVENPTPVTPVVEVPIVENKPEINVEQPKVERPKIKYNTAEKKLISYISGKVSEKRDEVENILEENYIKVKDKVSREIFIALCAKYIRDEKISNLSYGVNQVISKLGIQ